MQADLPQWFQAVAPLVFVALWLIFGFGLAALGGWRALAEVYPGEAPATPEIRLRFQSGRLRWIQYNGILEFQASREALHLSVFFLFRSGHSPIAIPWSEIEARARRVWMVRLVELSFAREPSVKLRISTRLAGRLAVASGGLLQVEPPA